MYSPWYPLLPGPEGTTCESLKKEKFLYLAEARPYDKSDRFNLLVERVESLISEENTNWSELITSIGNQEGK